MSKPNASVVDKARDYYDSSDADNFYYSVWGGEDIHVGWYASDREPIADASRRTVEHMAARLTHRPAATQVLDIGAGYGGSARYLARESLFRVVCLNLSTVQNERNREMNAAQNLQVMVDVVDGSFEDLPFDDDSFDVVWSQDAILHSGDRMQVFREVDRVLRSGGEFIFTDPMQQPGVPAELLQPVLDRIHLDSMGSIATYEGYARELGWETVAVEEASDKLVTHYSRVREELERREADLVGGCSADYIGRMKQGLTRWIEAGKKGALSWGILHFRKP